MTSEHRPRSGTPTRRKSRKASRHQLAGFLFVAPALALVLLFFVIPLGMAFWMSLHNWPLLGKPRFIGLPNILYGNDLVAEFVAGTPQPEPFIDEIERLLEEPGAVERQRAGFARVRAGMEKGAPEAPLSDAVDRLLANLPQRLASGT